MSETIDETVSNKERYSDFTCRYIRAFKAFKVAEYTYESAKHGTRLELYAKKAAGEKYTEEQIRTMSIVKNDELYRAYIDAEITFEAARSALECAKDIYNKENK